MIIIASNMTTRDRKFAAALAASLGSGSAHESAPFIGSLARECVAAGASVLDINLHGKYDTPELMHTLVSDVQLVCNSQLCLSCGNPETLEAGLKICQRPPIVNYVSMDISRLDRFLPLAAQYSSEVILMTADPVPLLMLEDNLKTAAVLVGAANEAGIPNSRIFIDPGVLHVTYSAGQQHCQTLMNLIPAISEAFEPEVRTTCWINNVSAGTSRNLRPFINGAFMAMLSGLGLSSAFIDILEPNTARMTRLLRIFRNELIFSEAEMDRHPEKVMSSITG